MLLDVVKGHGADIKEEIYHRSVKKNESDVNETKRAIDAEQERLGVA